MTDQERAAVVAWLLRRANASGIPGLMDRLDHIAFAIERLDHLTDRPAP